MTSGVNSFVSEQERGLSLLCFARLLPDNNYMGRMNPARSVHESEAVLVHLRQLIFQNLDG